MFTGLIQAVGRLHRRGDGLIVEGCNNFSSLTLGESVAVDGVCLTVKDLIRDGFLADISEETLNRTTLGTKSQEGGVVNLERALRFSDRLGGHLVSGHVDGLGEITCIDQLGNSWRVEMKLQDVKLGRYISEKGSISVNGISLTVAGCSEDGDSFWTAVIPHTFMNTSLHQISVGALVNLEADLIAKYVERLLIGNNQPLKETEDPSSIISTEWLASHGWG